MPNFWVIHPATGIEFEAFEEVPGKSRSRCQQGKDHDADWFLTTADGTAPHYAFLCTLHLLVGTQARG